MVAAAVGKSIRSALAAGYTVPFTTREIGTLLADWFQARRDGELALPWLRSDSRWVFVASEVLGTRASPTTAISFYSVLKDFDIEEGSLPSAPLIDRLGYMADGVGRSARVQQLRELTAQMADHPLALWAPTIDRTKLPAIPVAVADLAELALPTVDAEGQGEGSEEPVLTGRGVLRVASRFLGNDVDKRNKLTDGRLAVARLIGLGEASRHAQLGLVELAASVCLADNPVCEFCPLRDHCLYANGVNETPTSLF